MIHFARFLSPVMEPLTFCLLLLIAGLGLHAFNRRKAAGAFFIFGIGLLVIFSYGIFTKPVLYHLERLYAPLNVEGIPATVKGEIRYVVVLGSGHVSDPVLTRTAQIGGSSLYRLIEGIRIYRELPGTKLVISGGVIPDPVTNARVVGDVAHQIGVPVKDTLIEERPSDTIDEARVLKGLIGDRSFVLVTSAAHMKRAVRIFQDRGMKPVPAPTDYVLKDRQGGNMGSWAPNCGNLFVSQRVIYEWLAEAWGRIRAAAFSR
jgi:uncharacterized SAM-binding protein YcdF (DUF218 family)